VIVGNSAGVTLSDKATLDVLQSPFVVDPPRNLSVPLGGAAMFGVRLLGESPFTFQWRRDGVPISGETNATLTIPAVATTNSSLYSVAITNAFGGVVSTDAALSVTRPTFNFGRGTTNGAPGLALNLPPEATGFILEGSPTLGAGAVWTPIMIFTTPPVGPIILPFDPAIGLRFYRLRAP
jgi:hypothetical protein